MCIFKSEVTGKKLFVLGFLMSFTIWPLLSFPLCHSFSLPHSFSICARYINSEETVASQNLSFVSHFSLLN